MPTTRAQSARTSGFAGGAGSGFGHSEWRPPGESDGQEMDGFARREDGQSPASTAAQSRPEPLKRKQSQAKAKRRAIAGLHNARNAPPIYQIDLSRPPAERYVQVATDFARAMRSLTALFDQVVGGDLLGLSGARLSACLKAVHVVASLLLRRLPESEQTEELRGISRATGIDMYLLICFNTLLDLFMGCSSGAMRTRCRDGGLRMLHFRTLDWGMDGLRKLAVQLEFVDKPHGQVVARSITYAGFVGFLTGVRPGLSVSLNFRPCHNNSGSPLSNVKFYGNHLLVLLGLRPSISSHLRSFFLPSRRRPAAKLPDLDHLTAKFPSTPTTSAYIIASDGRRSVVFEKDRVTASVRSSASMVVATNHDVSAESTASNSAPDTSSHAASAADVIGMQEILDESVDRKQCVVREWQSCADRMRRAHPHLTEDDVAIMEPELIDLIQKWPVTNECTHIACVMDPAKGEVVWCRRWKTPAQEPEDWAGAWSN